MANSPVAACTSSAGAGIALMIATTTNQLATEATKAAPEPAAMGRQ
jgi:hypothetical protein